MKLKLLLGVSIVLNVVALSLLFRAPTGSSPTTAPEAAKSGSEPRLWNERAAGQLLATPDWLQVLRRDGVSEGRIAELAAADFENRWRNRVLENQKKFNRGEIDQDAMDRFALEHDAEQERELRAMLGDEGFRRWDKARIMLDFELAGVELTGAESDALYGLRKDLDRKRIELDQKHRQEPAEPGGGERQADTGIYAEYSEQLQAILGDSRYAQLRLGGNPGLGDLRRDLRAMNVKDTLVPAMEQAQQDWNAQRGKLEVETQKGRLAAPEYEQQMKAITAERDREHAKVLGADQFAIFQRNQDDRYRTMKRLAPSLGYSDSDINNLYRTIQRYESDVHAFREQARAMDAQGQAVDWEEVENSLRQFTRQTENSLREALGTNFETLKQNHVMPFVVE